MASSLGTVERLLECPICMEVFTDPRILPCHHTLCRGCLERHVSASGQQSKFNCPSCRRECHVPKGGVTTIPKNFFLNSFRELLHEHQQKGDSGCNFDVSASENWGRRECDNTRRSSTPHGKTTVFCVDCAEFFCESCENSHRMFAVSCEHQLIPKDKVDATTVKDSQRQKRIPRCELHRTCQLDIYCDTCSVPVCTKCCLLTHQQHKYRELIVVGEERRNKLSHLLEAAAAHISKLQMQRLQQEASISSLQTDTEKACQEVHQAADELKRLVTKNEQALIQELRESEMAALTRLRSAGKETEINIANVQSVQSYMEVLRVSGSITDQVAHTVGLEEQLHQQQSLPLRPIPRFTVTFRKDGAKFAWVYNKAAALRDMLGSVCVYPPVMAFDAVVVSDTAAAAGDDLVDPGATIDKKDEEALKITDYNVYDDDDDDDDDADNQEEGEDYDIDNNDDLLNVYSVRKPYLRRESRKPKKAQGRNKRHRSIKMHQDY